MKDNTPFLCGVVIEAVDLVNQHGSHLIILLVKFFLFTIDFLSDNHIIDWGNHQRRRR